MTKDDPVARNAEARIPSSVGPVGTRSPRERQESRKGTLVNAAVLLLVITVAFLLAPLLDATPFWQDHFGGHSSRTGLLLWAPLLLASTLTRSWRPFTWENELLSRGIRNIAHALLLWWVLDPLLAAPRLAALAVFPLLLATPLLALNITRTSTPLSPQARRPLLVTAVAATTTSFLIPVLLWIDPPHWLLGLLAIPLVGVHVALSPYGVHRARTVTLTPHPINTGDTQDPSSPGPVSPPAESSASRVGQDPASPAALDLPPGTLRPPTSPLRLVLTIGGLFIVLLLVAPGLPLSATIAWGALVFALPLILHAVVTRSGTADPRAIAGPATMHRHESRVLTILDENLEEIDEAIERFLRWGTGRKDLAEKISTLLVQADEDATPDHLESRLALLPRLPWSRRAREDGLVALLRPRLEGSA